VNELYFVLAGLGLGFSLTVPPGPMNALIASRTMRSLRAGITTGLGAMSADAVLGAIVYVVRVSVDFGPWVRWIDGVGAVVLSGMAYRLLREHRAEERRPATDVRVFTEALVVGVTNPFQILWWVTAGLAFAYVGGALLLVGLFAAIAVWVVVFPYVLSVGVRRDARVPRLVSLASTLLLGAFAVYLALGAAGVVL